MSSPHHLLGQIIDGRYRLREFIGRGSFGAVFAADEFTLGRIISQVAVKIITPESSEQRKSVMREIVGLAQLHHDYIIAYRSSGEIREGPIAGSIFLATELGDTTLSDAVRNNERLSEEEFRELITGITLALSHIHSAGAIHADVKPANIIRVRGRWKLGDLGLLKSTKTKWSGPAQGSLSYMAPEVLRHEFSHASDIYSLGATILWYFTGQYAYEAASREEFVQLLLHEDPKVPDWLREPWRSLVIRCLDRNPDARPTAQQILTIVGPNSRHFAFADSDRVTLVVAPNGHGHFESLATAIEQAPPGARILLNPGEYREPLRLDRSVEIVGDGPPEEILVVVHDETAVQVATNKPVLLRGFTIKTRRGDRSAECYGLDILEGRPLIKDCVIESETLASVAVHDGADPTFKRCQILGSQDTGVFVYDRGRGTFDACDIFSNNKAGVTVSEGGDSLFKRCRIYDNGGHGVAVLRGGSVTLEGCHLLSNGQTGLAVAGRAVARKCRMSDNAGFAVDVREGARVTVHRCDLRGNAAGAWRTALICEVDQSDNVE
jgi:F-box protein 11